MEDLFKRRSATKGTKTGQLIMLRHGESAWNDQNRFTGWANVELTDKGRKQAMEAAEMLLSEPGLQIDMCYTSVLQRSIETAELCLDAWERDGRHRPEVQARWRLNERHYGSLTGLNKREALQTIDATKLREWRSSFEGRPSPMAPSHPHYSRTQARYKRLLQGDGGEAGLRLSDVPLTESLADTRERVRPLWLEELRPAMLAGQTVLLVGHANCLRALISCIQTSLRDEHLPSLGVPNALPLVYSFDAEGRLRTELEGRCYVAPFDAHYLGDSCQVFNELSGAGQLPPEADNNGDGVVDFNEYMAWESRLQAARGGEGGGSGRGRGVGGGGSGSGRIRG